MAVDIDYLWRGSFENATVNALHADAFDHPPVHDDWRARLDRHSLGWVTARDLGRLVGFVNVVWDGGAHAFILDTLVSADCQRRGVGRKLVAVAARAAREAGCEWLHVDFEERLDAFYVSCGFTPTKAGLIRLGP